MPNNTQMRNAIRLNKFSRDQHFDEVDPEGGDEGVSLPGGLVNDGSMTVLKDDPVLLRAIWLRENMGMPMPGKF